MEDGETIAPARPAAGRARRQWNLYQTAVGRSCKRRAWQARVDHFPPWLGLAVPGARHYQTEHYRNEPHRFATISLTGTACALNCAHCGRHLLDSMYAAPTPEELDALGHRLLAQGCQGVLLSGGADALGAVPLRRHLPAIAALKKMGLRVIVHTGLTDQETAEGLFEAGIDQALFDVIGAEETIRAVYGLPYTPQDYARGLAVLRRAGLQVAPHVVIGLHFGQVRGELNALGDHSRGRCRRRCPGRAAAPAQYRDGRRPGTRSGRGGAADCRCAAADAAHTAHVGLRAPGRPGQDPNGAPGSAGGG